MKHWHIIIFSWIPNLSSCTTAGSHYSAPPSSSFRRRTTVSHGSRRSSTHSEVDLRQPPQFPHHLHADRVLFFMHLLPLRFAPAHHSNITHPSPLQTRDQHIRNCSAPPTTTLNVQHCDEHHFLTSSQQRKPQPAKAKQHQNANQRSFLAHHHGHRRPATKVCNHGHREPAPPPVTRTHQWQFEPSNRLGTQQNASQKPEPARIWTSSRSSLPPPRLRRQKMAATAVIR